MESRKIGEKHGRILPRVVAFRPASPGLGKRYDVYLAAGKPPNQKGILLIMSPSLKRKLEAILPRFLTDFVVINASVILAVVLRVSATYLATADMAERQQAIELGWQHITTSLPMINLITLAIFVAFGFYTRTRMYRRKYKALVVTQAVVASALTYLAVMYLFEQNPVLPRTAWLLAYTFILFGAGAARFAKSRLETHYEVRPKKRRDLPAKLSKRILVIGGAGYIGSHVARQLLDKGFQVRVLDLVLFGEESIQDLLENPNFELIKGDFRHVGKVVEACRDVMAVVHLGAVVGDPACAYDEDYTKEVNYAATRMIREICRGAGIRRFVFASTCSVYGASDEIADERSQLNPVSLYAQTKIDSERAILEVEDEEFCPTILRFATVFGLSSRPRFDLVINIVTAMAVKEGKCAIFGGSQWRPFVHVSDLARAVVKVIESPEDLVNRETFNVGDDELNMQLSEVGDAIEKLFPDVEVVRQEEDVDRRNYRVSFQKIRDILDFRCQVSVEEGIQELKEALETGKIEDFRATQYSNLALLKDLKEGGSPEVRASQETPEKVISLPLS